MDEGKFRGLEGKCHFLKQFYHTIDLNVSFSGAPGGHQGVGASVVLCGVINDQPVFGPLGFHAVP